MDARTDLPEPTGAGTDNSATDRSALDEEALTARLGPALPAIARFAAMLVDQGEERGLIGPRELERLWERHLLNSAAVEPFLGQGTIVDVGSGAGLPGLVVAALRPAQRVILVEPMERRVAWLTEAAGAMGLANVEVVRGRAEEVRGSVKADALTARAVASIDKLIKWCAPLLSAEGTMAFLKGRSAADEVDAAKYVLRKAGLWAEVLVAPTLEGLEPTTVVRLGRSARVG